MNRKRALALAIDLVEEEKDKIIDTNSYSEYLNDLKEALKVLTKMAEEE